MNAREKSALEHNLIKLFMMPQEVGLVVSCLNWVKAELQMANENLLKLNTEIVGPIRLGIPDGTFTVLLPIIEATVKSILVESASHFDEKGDKKGKANLLEELDKMGGRTMKIQEFTWLVSTGTQLQAMYQKNEKGGKKTSL